MKNSVNFAQSFSDRENSFKRWIRFSSFLFLLLLAISGLLTFSVIRERRLLAYELSLLKKRVEPVYKDNLEGGEISENPVDLKNKKIMRIKNGLDNPALYLKEISKNIPDFVRIISLRREHGKQLEIVGQANKISDVGSFAKALKQSKCFDFCTIKSIDPQKKNMINFSLSAHLRK